MWKKNKQGFRFFFTQCYGSVNEVETQLMIAEKLGYVDSKKIKKLIEELHHIGKMLVGLIKNMQGRDVK